MEQTKYTQQEILNLINQYNSIDRKVIKSNLERIINQLGLKRKDLINLGFSSPNVYSWFAPTAPNIPMFDQALTISVMLSFNIEEFLENN